MPVLAVRALPTPYLEEDGLVSVGGVAGEVAGVVGVAGAGLHPIGTPGGRTIN